METGDRQRNRDRSRRAERAHRILDAAAALILRYGYNKTSLDDIAREAGVAKGTLYLHWRSREELFGALLIREKAELTRFFLQSVAADPVGPTLHGILKHSALALMRRPLIKAVLLRDLDVVGRLVHSEAFDSVLADRLTAFKAYLRLLADHGLLRADIDLDQQLYVVASIFLGFFLTEPLLPVAVRPTEEQRADLLAEAVRRTLEPEHAGLSEPAPAVAEGFLRYAHRASAAVEAQLQRALDSQPTRKEEHAK